MLEKRIQPPSSRTPFVAKPPSKHNRNVEDVEKNSDSILYPLSRIPLPAKSLIEGGEGARS